MHCPKCGRENKEGAAFCAGCGCALSTTEQAAPPQNNGQVAQGAPAFSVEASSAGAPGWKLPEQLSSLNGVVETVKKRPKFFGVVAAAVVVVIAVVVFVGMNMTGAFTLGQNAETFKQAFSRDDIVTYGVVANSYVNDSPYELTSCQVKNIRKINDSQLTAEISATIENANFKSDLTVHAEYRALGTQTESGYVGPGYQFQTIADVSTPKKGIDRDPDHGLGECTAELGEDGMSCTVAEESSAEFWFARSETKKVYSYRFHDNMWSFDKVDIQDSVIYQDMEGDYAAKSGDLKKFSQFTISNLDPGKGTFSINYVLNPRANTDSTTYSTATGTMNATIDRQQGSNGSSAPLEDGYTYMFDAQGSSDGGAGSASCIGYLLVDASGEKIIKIDKGSFDYTLTQKDLHGDEHPHSDTLSFSNLEQEIMYQQ